MISTGIFRRTLLHRLVMSFAFAGCIAGFAGLASTIDSRELSTFRVDVGHY